jgi:serine/threonine protein kinase
VNAALHLPALAATRADHRPRATNAEPATERRTVRSAPSSSSSLSAIPSVLELLPGDPVALTPYRVGRRIAAGGMGELYEVVHPELGRRAAMKVLHRRHVMRADLALRMRDEARMLASLTHPNLPTVYDAGTLDDGRPFLVMELLEGNDLRRELARFGMLAVPSAVGLVAQALSALSAVHQASIVHRDVKLENLFLCTDGRLKLLDFGIARTEDVARLGRTGRGVALGTPRSMAPEQYEASEVDARTDLYAVGVALFELVTGRGLFDEVARTVDALRLAHCERPPPRPSAVARQPVSEAFDRVVTRALHKEPSRRYASADELRRALLDAVRAPSTVDDEPTDFDRLSA